jgi:hypothetical protein
MGRAKPLYVVGLKAISTTIESSVEILQKTEDRTDIRSSDTTPGHLPEGT